jgi:hypothetical protein
MSAFRKAAYPTSLRTESEAYGVGTPHRNGRADSRATQVPAAESIGTVG